MRGLAPDLLDSQARWLLTSKPELEKLRLLFAASAPLAAGAACAAFFFFVRVGRISPSWNTSAGRSKLVTSVHDLVQEWEIHAWTYFRMCLILIECLSTLYSGHSRHRELKFLTGSDMSRARASGYNDQRTQVVSRLGS